VRHNPPPQKNQAVRTGAFRAVPQYLLPFLLAAEGGFFLMKKPLDLRGFEMQQLSNRWVAPQNTISELGEWACALIGL
jgi:hypothetical protein